MRQYKGDKASICVTLQTIVLTLTLTRLIPPPYGRS